MRVVAGDSDASPALQHLSLENGIERHHFVTEILQEMLEHGLDPGTIICDGRIHRFSADSKDKKKSGWYLAFQNHTRKSGEIFYVAIYGNYADPNSPWKFQSNNVSYSSDDRKAIKEQIAKAQREQESERQKLQEETAQEVSKIWENLNQVGETFYLNKKFINVHGLGVRYDGNGNVYVPLRDSSGKIWSMQKIQSDGGKWLHSGGRKRGCFHVIGDAQKSENIFIVEGFATGASVFLATGQAVVVAIDSGNLLDASTAIKKLYYEKPITICGDDDRWGTENIGRRKAEEAAEAVLGRAVFPTFREPGQERPTDFNDLHCLEGIEAVRRQLNAVTEEKRLTTGLDKNAIIRVPYPDDEEFSKSARRGTLANVRELLRRLGVIVRYNLVSKEEEILIPGAEFSVDNKANATIAHIIDWCERVKIPHGNLNSYLTAMADANPYNPVVTWIESKKWDGVERFEKFCDTIKAKNENDIQVRLMKNIMIRRWMISGVAAAFEPDGVVARGMLVLQGAQYMGKTKWFKSLAPAHLNVRADGVILRPDDKDSVFQAVSKWLVELGELDGTLSKSDAAQLKAFIPKQHDEIRRPYAKKESKYARRTVFFGSVNEMTFLKDPTGNSRFWTIECESIDYNHAYDMQQVWAEVLTFYRSGETWFLDAAEMDRLSAQNEDFQQVEPIEEKIRENYRWESSIKSKCSATKVCEDVGIREPKKSDTMVAARILRRLGCYAGKSNGVSQYNMPPLKNSSNQF